MCGIAGKVYLDGLRPVDAFLIRRMTQVMAHRGPDGEGHYVAGPVALGHRRLSIIDVDTGSQPMCNEDGTVWITFNGEIYNYIELRRDLRQRGHVFKSMSDTEVIVHLYEEYGEECLSRLKGMFAFAIWDARMRKLFLARDRVGIKPLYYTRTGGALLFASEIKSLLQDACVARRFNPRTIDRFFTYYYSPGQDTLFDGIYRLEPGHCMTVHEGRVTTRQYWDLKFDTDPHWRRFDEAVDALQDLLQRTVQSHMLSDVPVGVLLSGGVDSTGMLRHAAQHSSNPVQTFTVGFDGEHFADERPYARLAAETYGAAHQEISLSATDFGDLLPHYAWHMEEPVCEPPAVALYAVSRRARESGVKVLLSGEGGDEAFGGYNKYSYLLALERMKAAFRATPGLLRSGLELMAHLNLGSLRNFTPLIDLPLPEYYFSCASTPYTPFNRLKTSLYRESFVDALGSQVSDEPTRRLFKHLTGLPLLHQMLHVDTKTWLPDDLLIKADKMTMATSVELRVPFLDSDVLEFAATLPAHFKIRGWPPKRILRAALKDSVPAAILERKKVGFPVPYDRWMRSELRELVLETIHGRHSVLNDYFDSDAMTRLTNAHGRGEGGSQEVFSLLILELLHQQFIKAPDVAPPNDEGTTALELVSQ
jgi:asparagine synthase (glutamine-hydrolysing)